ncbi:trypsin inhibitor-like [Drosophila biarmipes]|uniref:trypsin inhibitor-like n=1 Tax=Drosophila biarmipes TaxID=125945 RepID=UPI0007E65D17|nr:trypsin inhibitor-like [Drosophila biarmipes]
MAYISILTTLALATVFPSAVSYRLFNREICYAAPSVTGMCKGDFPAVTYKGGKCIDFTYGGSGATPNFFNSMEDCYATCMDIVFPET